MAIGEAAGSGGATPRIERIVLEAYERYAWGFLEITRRARQRFERRQWRGLQADVVERFGLYQRVVDDALLRLGAVGARAGSPAAGHAAWRQAKRRFCALVCERADAELAETFFSSVARRALGTVGVDPETEFTRPGHLEPAPPGPEGSVFRRYPVGGGGLVEVVRAVLVETGLPLAGLEADARRAGAELERLLAERDAPGVERVDLLEEPFYRGHAAYLVGRLWAGEEVLPFVLALLNPPEGIAVDAVLVGPREVGPIFSLSRTYFFHAQPRVRATVRFLAELTRKPVAELYTALGHKRHGKTELFRHFNRRLAEKPERFEVAPGVKGLVMIVFTLPSAEVVFKVIRDRPAQPKDVTREEVRRHYRFVFERDRVGRLLDAQELEYLRLPRRRFDEELLAQLLSEAGETVSLDGEAVVLAHAYAERKVVPLDVFVRTRDEAAVRAAVLDYGRAIKDLAAANIFPGDILLKNFGVKSDGRVVFYDYDEIGLLTDFDFRAIPFTDDPVDELRAEPWFYVGPRDVFPEELETFIALPDRFRRLLREKHGEIFQVGFWRRMQERHRAGELVRVLPYERRLPPARTGPPTPAPPDGARPRTQPATGLPYLE